MDPLRLAVLVLHISAAALVFGGATGIVRSLKTNLELGGEAFKLATGGAARQSRIVAMSSIVTLASGLGLIFMAGGFGAVPLNFHIALAIMLGAIVVSSVTVGPSVMKLSGLALAENVDKDASLKLIKRIAMGTGILHLLWLIMLTLMFVRIYK